MAKDTKEPQFDRTDVKAGGKEEKKIGRPSKAVCPTNPAHHGARIYSTRGLFSYAICDDCGATWKVARQENLE